MKTGFRVKNMAFVGARINAKGKSDHKAAVRALLKAGLFIQRNAQKETPVDTGFLKSSAYKYDMSKLRPTPTVEIGFHANYAVNVHEINKNYRVGNWHFLRNAFDKNRREIKIIIIEELRK